MLVAVRVFVGQRVNLQERYDYPLEVVDQPLDEHAKRPKQLVVSIFDQLRNSRGDVPDALGNSETKLAEEAANLISLGCASLHKALMNPVQRQNRLLFSVLDSLRDEFLSTMKTIVTRSELGAVTNATSSVARQNG